jgi:hypothetical protein
MANSACRSEQPRPSSSRGLGAVFRFLRVWRWTWSHSPKTPFSSQFFRVNVPLKTSTAGCDEDHFFRHRRSTELQPYPQPAAVSLHCRAKVDCVFNTVLERTEAQIVLTSSWRYDPAGLFSAKHWGIPFVDITPDLPKESRRNEILAWLRDHTGVTRFAVLDDEEDELDGLPLFQPSAFTGLTEELAQGLVDYLAGSTDKDMRSSRLRRTFQNFPAILTGHRG